MTTSFDVACLLVELAGREPEPEALTPLRVQKLVYYCQGWALALLGKPLFADRIEAWRHGPVAVDLHRRLQAFEGGPLTPEKLGAPAAIPEIERELVGVVWERFRDLSASGLFRRTHAESPWLGARNGLPDEATGGEEITLAAMAAFFSAELDKEAVGGVTPRQAWAGYRDVLEGRVSTKADTFARLRGKACTSS